MTPLELLASSNGCFISDLRYRALQELDFAALLSAPNAAELEEWQTVMAYIFPQVSALQSVEEIKAYIGSQAEKREERPLLGAVE